MELEGKAKDLLAIEANVIEEAVTKLSIVITHLLHFLQYILQAVHKRVRKC